MNGNNMVANLPWREVRISLLVLSYWAYVTFPSATNLFIAGRGPESPTITSTAMGNDVRDLLFVWVVAFSLGVMGSAIWNFRWAITNLMLVVALSISMLVLQVVHLDIGKLASIAPAYLVLLACLIDPAPVAVAKTLGLLTAVTAMLSLVWIVVDPATALMTEWSHGNEKKIFASGVLAGPFSHANIMGMTLVVGLPWISFFANRILRLASATVVLLALLWAASRTAMAVLVLLVVSYGVVRIATDPFVKKITMRLIITAIVAVGVLLPFIVQDSDAFEGRGGIWQASKRAFLEQPLWGSGQPVFEHGSVVDHVGYITFHAHNLYLTALAREGLLGFAILLSLIGILSHYAVRAHSTSLAPFLSLVALCATGWIEVSFEITQSAQNAGFTWLVAIAVLTMHQAKEKATPWSPINQLPSSLRLAL